MALRPNSGFLKASSVTRFESKQAKIWDDYSKKTHIEEQKQINGDRTLYP